jgi:WD40 repeat protein
VWSVIQLSDGNLATTSADGTVRIWDPAKPRTTIATYTGHTGRVFSVVELTDGNLASAGADGVKVWDPTRL